MTTPPISVDIRSGLLIKDTAFQRHSMRFNIMEANQCAANIVAAHGFDVLGRSTHSPLIVDLDKSNVDVKDMYNTSIFSHTRTSRFLF